ncbi:Sec-independent protein translocase family protein [Krasilnikoviella flava]|uniref:Sec-independent protein translocase protein TatB n=1 Tax=Krasilnikoviella flava TaxID=526729 RepID=A0A1T5JM02_9MICO|nr:Sec-independent protein translocase TatB [Krasilnikoviella flava]SKC52607.1 sec-independent protein translocase protein TatB [Krasilnikoviella flava]
MFDINGGELLIIVVLAVLLIGPERLPGYAAQLASLVKRGKRMLQDTKARVDTELGPEFKDVDWSKLDPRQYDPRRIVREALMDDDEEPAPARSTAAAAAAGGAATPAATSTSDQPRVAVPAPFDDEAT